MDLEPDAVTHAVAVRLAETRSLDQRSRGGVGVAPVHAGRDRSEPGELRPEAEPVQLREARRHLADCERSRAVRAVAVEDAACVDGDEDAGLDG